MSNFAVVSDSTCDLGADLRKKFDIDYVKMNYVVNGEEIPASLDWERQSAHEFYDYMRNGSRITTTQVPRKEFERCFGAYLEAGKDIVYISCSSALSGSVNLARLVAKELSDKYPGREIYCVDSLCSSLGQGMMALMASHLRAEGKSAEETAAFIEENRLKVNQYGTVDSLEFLRRAGRVKASSAFFGNIFGVKPIVMSDITGQNYAFKKVKGAQSAKREIAELVRAAAEKPEEQTLFISHADDRESAERLRNEILAVTGLKNVYISYIGPIVGASVGPGTIISFCYGKEVTIEGKE